MPTVNRFIQSSKTKQKNKNENTITFKLDLRYFFWSTTQTISKENTHVILTYTIYYT